MKVKITEKLELNKDDNWRINLHSFYNITQVLFTEINILQLILGKSEQLEKVMDMISDLKDALTNPERTLSSFKGMRNFKANIFSLIDQSVINNHNLSKKQLDQLEESLTGLEKVVTLTENRAEDFIKLLTHQNEWINFDIETLIMKLKDVMKAMSIHSKGRYGIVFDKSAQQENDYLINITIDAEQNNILLPALFPDVIRDLTANARKYSDPGSQIDCTLKQSTDHITLIVKDNGYGIPADEIPNVVKYGYRASNVDGNQTYGDGFGLTKAYMIVSNNNGSLWIDSELGKFTEVTIEIPQPQE